MNVSAERVMSRPIIIPINVNPPSKINFPAASPATMLTVTTGSQSIRNRSVGDGDSVASFGVYDDASYFSSWRYIFQAEAKNISV